jgi:hypothetical protein
MIKWPLMRRLVMFVLLASACRTPTSTPAREDKPPAPQNLADTRENALEVNWDLTPVGKPIEGEMGLVRMKLRNRSAQFCVFIKSVIDAESGLAVHWQRSRGGSVTYNSKEDEYVHDRTAHDPRFAEPLETPAVFNHGFLAPRITFEKQEYVEGHDVHLHIRLIRLPRSVAIEYFALTQEEVINNVYFPVHRASEKGEPHSTLDRYERPTQAGLDQIIKLRHISRDKTWTHKEDVIYPAVVYAPVVRRQVMVNLKVEQRAFSQADALAKSHLSEPDVKAFSYSCRFNAWVLRLRDDRTLLVDENSADEIGKVDPAIFDQQDTPDADGRKPTLVEMEFLDSDSVVLFLQDERYKPDKSKLKEGSIGRIYTADTRTGRRVFLNLKIEEWREFLKACGTFHLVLKQVPSGRISITAR